jgi:hypothetical protein
MLTGACRILVYHFGTVMVPLRRHCGTIVIPFWYRNGTILEHNYAKHKPERDTNETFSAVEKNREGQQAKPDERNHLPAGRIGECPGLGSRTPGFCKEKRAC